jgi:hypothetical protein
MIIAVVACGLFLAGGVFAVCLLVIVLHELDRRAARKERDHG